MDASRFFRWFILITALAVSLFAHKLLLRDTPATIAFVSDRDGNPEIYTVLADGTGLKRLTNDPGKDQSPCWSPDGKWIAFVSNRSGRWDVWKMAADGTGLQNLTHEQDRQDSYPMWCASEPYIAFVSSRRFYTVTPDGTFIYERSEYLLPPDAQAAVSPAVLKYAFRNAKGQLATLEATDVKVVPLSYGVKGVPAQIFNPAWSSDGQELIFDSGGATPKIFTADLADGTCDPVMFDGYGTDPVFANGDGSVVFTMPKGEGTGSDIGIVSLDGVTGAGLPKPINLTHITGNDSQPSVFDGHDES